MLSEIFAENMRDAIRSIQVTPEQVVRNLQSFAAAGFKVADFAALVHRSPER